MEFKIIGIYFVGGSSHENKYLRKQLKERTW